MVNADMRTLRIWRGVLCLTVAFDTVVVSIKSHWRPLFDATVRAPLGPLGTDLALVALALLALYGLARYAGRKSTLGHALLGLAGMEGCFAVYAAIYPTGHEDLVQASAALLGWVAAHAIARAAKVGQGRGVDGELVEMRWAAFGFLTLLGATYMNAAMSKLSGSGGRWAGSDTLQLMVLSHFEYGRSGGLTELRWQVGQSAALCSVLSGLTLVVQLGAFALVIDRTRRLWAFFLLSMHLGIYASSRILFVQVLVVLAAIVVPWSWRKAPRGESEGAPPDTSIAERASIGRALLGAAAAGFARVAAGATLGLGR